MAGFHQEGEGTTLHALYEGFDRGEYLLTLDRSFTNHRTFNYPLVGEFSLTTHLARGGSEGMIDMRSDDATTNAVKGF